MPTCCIDNLCRVICDATFEPVLVCDEWRPLACNTRLLEVFHYKDESEVTSQPIREFVNKHFTPKEVVDNGETRQVKVLELTYALVASSDMSEKMAIAKVKQWEFENRPYYTISIRDVHILKLANKEPAPMELEQTLVEPLSILNKTSDTHFDPSDEPELESRLLQEFSLLADAIPSMVWVCGREGEIYYANKRVKETWGIDVLQESWQECIHPVDWESFIPQWKQAQASITAFSHETRYRNKYTKPDPEDPYNGYRWHIFQSIPIFGKDGVLKRWVLTAMDVHDWKCAEAEKQKLAASEKMAIEASRLKSAFLSMMSHEIRTPLFGIVGNTCLLMETDIDDDQRAYIDTIDGSARLMMSVIQDILDFSRIEANKLNLQLAPFSLKRLINRCARAINNTATKKGLKFIGSNINYDLNVVGDQSRVQQVLTNIASNAIKFTHTGSVTLESTSKLLNNGKIVVRIVIKDTGIGMGPDVTSKLFAPWTQADSSNRRLYGGSGLGLAITKSLVDMMGGRIGLSSEMDVGSIFWVELIFPEAKIDDLNEFDALSSPESNMKISKFEFYDFKTTQLSEPLLNLDTPLSPIPEVLTRSNKIQKVSKVSSPGNNTSTQSPVRLPNKKVKLDKFNLDKSKKSNNLKSQLPNGKKFQVLLAEDNPINQAILIRFLEKMGCVEYILANDGVLALETYLSKPKGHFDLILLDQSMPRMDGDMVCQEIRKKYNDLNQVIISVSANALLSDRTYFLEVGMNDHISKPVTFVNFRETLTKWLLEIKPKLSTCPDQKNSTQSTLPTDRN